MSNTVREFSTGNFQFQLSAPAQELIDAVSSLAAHCNDEQESPQSSGNTLTYLIRALHAVNARQWRAEDEVRDSAAADAKIVAAKHRIDELNLQRHRYTEAIDSAVVEHLPMADEAELHTETIGMIVDRLSILELRRHHFIAKSRTADRVERQIHDLRDGLLQLLRRCAAGERRIAAYHADKMYGGGGS
jgi:hypothetical protein